jgi:hypothetical protein
MKNEHQENGVRRGPLILMVPASNLVAVLNLDWLDGTNQAAVFTKMHGRNYLANPPRTQKDFGETSASPVEPLSLLCRFESSLSIHPDGSIMIR